MIFRRYLKSSTSHQLALMKEISRREMEILSYISESMTNDEIAQKLFLSAKTELPTSDGHSMMIKKMWLNLWMDAENHGR